ncbi:alpha-glucuronidase [Microbacterium immunditiarum]|uniref:Alpha-glucuronidase n=1 Tax=Microbacterium immunditiarum TaxID=337480 RepID=A0A7Y9KL73_9MICO|nr:alpha-glucuronidase [Microbacterium immunditiarum]NYE21426.1 alpha-glucuronidase [Microbacterium immunditiarum]
MTGDPREVAPIGEHPMWLPDAATAHLRGRTVAVRGAGRLLETVRGEASRAGMVFEEAGGDGADLVIEATTDAATAPEGFEVSRAGGATRVRATTDSGALYGWFHVVRLGATAFDDTLPTARHEPQHAMRMLDHWDNVDVHPVMGQVERGYAGGSIFFADGRLRDDLSRVERYARLLASIGINRVGLNNVNVHAREARLLTDGLGIVARLADVYRPWGIRVHLSASFAAPITVGGLATADPLDPDVIEWWADAAARVYREIPDFGGFVVKADSEGQPGPFAYGRDHADGANVLARALAPHDGIVHWRAFVYNHRQDWRDRSTDRARAAYDHFTPLDGRFHENVVLQVKHGPMDFQVREPVSPVIPAMRETAVALELQVTQEYTGQQRHAVYLAPWWREILDFPPFGDGGPSLAETVRGGIVAVSNVGDDPFWTGHPLAQANLYAYGRLAWDAGLDPGAILDEWIALTFGDDEDVRRGIRSVLDDSWLTYEAYTAPLGVGFMVTPGSHYGPSVDGYEYSPWGTYHFADRDGVGVDRTVAAGTGFAGQYPSPWRETYESLETVPDELLLFFHHVPYEHVLRNGKTVIQHIYDTHIDGADAVDRKVAEWDELEGRVPADVFARGRDLLAEQQRSAREWRDHVCTYFWRKSGVPDAGDRVIP